MRMPHIGFLGSTALLILHSAWKIDILSLEDAFIKVIVKSSPAAGDLILMGSKYERNDSNSHQSSGSEGCFLTTACVDVKGLPGDCEELETLRKYRDTYLKNRENGWEDVNMYYDVAPRIVANINKLPNAKEIWENMYEDLVIPCVKLIKEGKNEETYMLYRNTVADLLKKYRA